MPYTPNATDPTNPLDTVDRSTAAAEFRAMKTYFNGKTTIASSATPDIFNNTNHLIDYTGAVTCTGFAAAPIAGADRTVICAGAAPFTAGPNLIIDGITSGNTLVVAAGTVLRIYAVTTTQFHIVVDTSLPATAAPPAIAAAGAIGSSALLAREDHTHAMGNLSGALSSVGFVTSLPTVNSGSSPVHSTVGAGPISASTWTEVANFRIFQDGTYNFYATYGWSTYYRAIAVNGSIQASGTGSGWSVDVAVAAGDTVQLFLAPYTGPADVGGWLVPRVNLAALVDKVFLSPQAIDLGAR